MRLLSFLPTPLKFTAVSSQILLVEDAHDDELLFKAVMQKAGVENPVAVVRGGADAIAYLEGRSHYRDRKKYPYPQILFLDLRMPGVDGFAVLEWLNTQPALRERLLVIVLSHLAEAREIRRAYELGADSFLPKPFAREDWASLIHHFEGYWDRVTGGSHDVLLFPY
jgi:CheY-like chemotaxis protein